MASQITSLTVVYSIVYSGADQRKHQSSASLAFVREITGTGDFPAQRASNAEIFPFDDVIMNTVVTYHTDRDRQTYMCISLKHTEHEIQKHQSQTIAHTGR